MEIISFDFNETYLKDFIAFPQSLYADDSNWIAPSEAMIRQQFSPDYPFYNHGEARSFLAYENKKVIGRITANINHRLVIDGEQIGHIGFFESIDNYEVTRQLLDASIGYLKEKGIKKVWGPVNFATLYEYRFVTKGFDKRTFFSDLYNPEYYPEYFKQYGFTQLRKYYTDYCEKTEMVLKKYKRIKKRFDDMGFTTRNIDLSRFDEELELFYDLMMRSLSDNFAFTHFDYDEFLCLYSKYKKIIRPDNFKFVYSPDNTPIGFYLAFHDLSGQHENAFLTKLMGVLPEYVHAGAGIALVYEMYTYIKEEGYDYSILPLRIEGNASRKFGKGLYTDYKEYGLFEYHIK